MSLPPLTLEVLADALNTPVSELRLPCAFCGQVLSLFDLWDFQVSNLGVVVRPPWLLGACRDCRRRVAAWELAVHAEVTVEGDLLVLLAGRSLRDVRVHCQGCLGEVSYTDKLRAVESQQPFVLVRKRWRTYCRSCGGGNHA